MSSGSPARPSGIRLKDRVAVEAEQALPHVGADQAGGDAVDADAGRRDLLRETFMSAFTPALATW